MCEDDCDMGASGSCMFKRLLPAISLASGYVGRGKCCSAVVWRTRVRRKWTRLARGLSEAAGLVGSPATRTQCCTSARTSFITRASPCPRKNNLGASERHGRDGDAWTQWTKWLNARRGSAGPCAAGALLYNHVTTKHQNQADPATPPTVLFHSRTQSHHLWCF
jgi:hypothetical protein